MPHKTEFTLCRDLSGNQFTRETVPKDGDCGYTAIGISRSEVYQLLLENAVDIAGLIVPAVKDELLHETFIQFVVPGEGLPASESDDVTRGLEAAFAEYVRVARLAGLPDEQKPKDYSAQLDASREALCTYSQAPRVIKAFLKYDIEGKGINGGWLHFAVLQAIAEVRKFSVNIYEFNEMQQLVPLAFRSGYHDRSYATYEPEGATETISLLYVDGNHFDKLFTGDIRIQLRASQATSETGLTKPDAGSASSGISEKLLFGKVVAFDYSNEVEAVEPGKFRVKKQDIHMTVRGQQERVANTEYVSSYGIQFPSETHRRLYELIIEHGLDYAFRYEGPDTQDEIFSPVSDKKFPREAEICRLKLLGEFNGFQSKLAEIKARSSTQPDNESLKIQSANLGRKVERVWLWIKLARDLALYDYYKGATSVSGNRKLLQAVRIGTLGRLQRRYRFLAATHDNGTVRGLIAATRQKEIAVFYSRADIFLRKTVSAYQYSACHYNLALLHCELAKAYSRNTSISDPGKFKRYLALARAHIDKLFPDDKVALFSVLSQLGEARREVSNKRPRPVDANTLEIEMVDFVSSIRDGISGLEQGSRTEIRLIPPAADSLLTSLEQLPFRKSMGILALEQLARERVEGTTSSLLDLAGFRHLTARGFIFWAFQKRALFYVIKNSPDLTTVEITGSPMEANDIRELSHSVVSNKKITSVTLRDTMLGDGALVYVNFLVRRGSNLIGIDLSDNPLFEEHGRFIKSSRKGFSYFISGLSYPGPQLQKMSLRNCGLNSEAMDLLVKAIREGWNAFSDLDFSKNPICDRDGKQLLELVRAKPRLTQLKLAGCDINEAIYDDIICTLEANRRSKQLERDKLKVFSISSDVGASDRTDLRQLLDINALQKKKYREEDIRAIIGEVKRHFRLPLQCTEHVAPLRRLAAELVTRLETDLRAYVGRAESLIETKSLTDIAGRISQGLFVNTGETKAETEGETLLSTVIGQLQRTDEKSLVQLRHLFSQEALDIRYRPHQKFALLSTPFDAPHSSSGELWGVPTIISHIEALEQSGKMELGTVHLRRLGYLPSQRIIETHKHLSAALQPLLVDGLKYKNAIARLGQVQSATHVGIATYHTSHVALEVAETELRRTGLISVARFLSGGVGTAAAMVFFALEAVAPIGKFLLKRRIRRPNTLILDLMPEGTTVANAASVMAFAVVKRLGSILARRDRPERVKLTERIIQRCKQFIGLSQAQLTRALARNQRLFPEARPTHAGRTSLDTIIAMIFHPDFVPHNQTEEDIILCDSGGYYAEAAAESGFKFFEHPIARKNSIDALGLQGCYRFLPKWEATVVAVESDPEGYTPNVRHFWHTSFFNSLRGRDPALLADLEASRAEAEVLRAERLERNGSSTRGDNAIDSGSGVGLA